MADRIYHWINDKVKIDFEVPKDIRYMMDECERLDLEEDCGYFNYAEALGDFCKEAYVQKHMTKEQWDIVESRYVV